MIFEFLGVPYTKWAVKNIKFFNKISKLIKEIQRTPFEGTGKPEQLKYEKKGYWSRRITKEHRLVYKIQKDVVFITSCKGHYEK